MLRQNLLAVLNRLFPSIFFFIAVYMLNTRGFGNSLGLNGLQAYRSQPSS